MRTFVTQAAKRRFNVGVVGYSAQYFDRKKARELLEELVEKASKEHGDNRPVSIVSGLTMLGVPAVAYNYAKENDLHTVGVAAMPATDYQCYPVHREIIEGEDWGDESERFLSEIHCLIRIGGGKQSLEECKRAKEIGLPVYEAELPALHSYCLMGFLSDESAKELHEEASKASAHDIKTPDSYHVTIRYWLCDPKDRNHPKKVKQYLRERFRFPVAIEMDFEGNTDVFGDEKAYVLHMHSNVLTGLFNEIDSKLQKLGAPPSDYPDYQPHVTILEGLEGKKPKLSKRRLIIDKWKLTKGTSTTEDSKTIWETEAKISADFHHQRVVTAGEQNFLSKLQRAKDIEEVLDYLVYGTPERTTKASVFDHILLTFMQSLPQFESRLDFEENELEVFKKTFPFEEYDLDGEAMREKLKNYRSLNRVIDEIVDEMSADHRNEIAREHLKNFWFEKCDRSVPKFVTALKPSYWLREVQ